ncbi:MAG: substrate-binding domain-containing protein [Planctomycetia bacterium]|nr:substrate-binding domain-containing protein [Planctomycetia bacterium]
MYRYRVLLFIETTNHFGRTIVEGINHYALEHNWLISFEQRGRFDPIKQQPNFLQADGIISRTFLRDSQDALVQLGLPMVELVGAFGPQLPIEVTMDEDLQTRMVFDHFYERGLRHFAFFNVEDAPVMTNRKNAFLNLVAERGFPCHTCFFPLRESNYAMPQWREEYREPLRQWLLSLPKPIGLYAGIDAHAKIILELCSELEIPVPRHISVVGVENDEWFCRIQHPTLSSVDTAGYTIGYRAAELLEAKMNGTYQKQPTVLVPPSFLAIRESSDFYAVDNEDILDALSFIRENACNRINTNDVVEAIGISRRSLYRGFERYLHRTPQDEIMRIQIETAKILLRETNILVTSIAARAGFTTPEYFVRAFRRETGMTPNQYRKQSLYGVANDDSDPGQEST